MLHSKVGANQSKVGAKQLKKEINLLDPIEVSNIISTGFDKPNISYTNPTSEVDFSHNYITDDLN